MMTANKQQFEMDFNKFFTPSIFEKLRKMLLSFHDKYCIYCEDDANEVIEESIIELHEQILRQWDEKDYHTQLTYGLISTICCRRACKRLNDNWVVNAQSLYKPTSSDSDNESMVIDPNVIKGFNLMHFILSNNNDDKFMIARQCLEQLSDKKKALILGFYIEDKSFEQLAEELGYSSAAVAKSTKCRIMAALTEAFQKRYQDYLKAQKLDIFGRRIRHSVA